MSAAILALLLAGSAQAYVAIVNKADHQEIHVVPAPGEPMHAVLEKDGYVVEAAVPWKDLGVIPERGMALRGDVGVIYGNEGGTRNAIRYLWSHKSPEVSINNDIPSEIRIHPNQCGSWMLE